MPGSSPNVRAAAASDEAALSETQLAQCLDVLIETTSTPLAIVSTLHGRYVRANQAMADLCGTTREQILRSDPFAFALALSHPDELVAEQRLFAELWAGKRRSYQLEKRYMRPDGSYRWGRLSFSGVFGAPIEGTSSAALLSLAIVHVVDITEHKAALDTLQRREEELRHAQKLDGLGQLAAGIAHDFNNLLTVIMGYGEALRDYLLLERDVPALAAPQAAVAAILDASDRAASLTAQLLAEGRREGTVPQILVLSDAVRTLQQLLVRTLGQHIEVQQSLEAVGQVLADRGHISQIVMNLVLNARDATPPGGRIRLITRDILDEPASGAGGWVVLVVSDTGHGMSEEVQARMFEPFFTTRSDRPGTRGTGLGLATVQRIVAEINGHIQVSSKLGEGTSITVYFPRAEMPRVRPTVVPSPRRAAPNSQRVLIIEEQPAVRSLIASVLLGAHYWVVTAADVSQAQRLIAGEKPFQLVIMELSTPDTSAAAFALGLGATQGGPRILFLSDLGAQLPPDIAPLGQPLAKPFTPSQLLAAADHILCNAETTP